MPKEKGRAHRHNEGKTKFVLIPWEWTKILAEIFTKGAKKYDKHNWKNSLNTDDHLEFQEDRLDSALRHINDYQQGKVRDHETGLDCLGHAAWNLLCVMWYDLNALNSKPQKSVEGRDKTQEEIEDDLYAAEDAYRNMVGKETGEPIFQNELSNEEIDRIRGKMKNV